MSKNEKLLIISPAFHGYCYSIADGFEQLGYETTVYRYDAFDDFTSKLRNKVLYELPSKVGFDGERAAEKDSTEKAIRMLQETNPDKLVVIKADILGTAFWEEVQKRKIPYILWLYDDLERHRYTLDFLKSMPIVVSYAHAETKKFLENEINAHYVPNGYDPKLSELPTKRNNEIVFVGSRYENREELMLSLKNAGIPVRAYGRQWSHHPFDRLRTWDLRRPDIPAERDITLAEAYRVQAGAAGAINVHIPQAGLAMRTFEVPGMGGIQLIDRPEVEEFYELDKEVLLYKNTEELIELCQRLTTDSTWSESIRTAAIKRSETEHTFYHRALKMDQIWA